MADTILPTGYLAFATDKSMAREIERDGSETQSKIDERIDFYATEGTIAVNPAAVIAAVEPAVDAIAIERDFITGADDRLPVKMSSDYIEGPIDAAGNLGWNAVRADTFGPGPHAVPALLASETGGMIASQEQIVNEDYLEGALDSGDKLAWNGLTKNFLPPRHAAAALMASAPTPDAFVPAGVVTAEKLAPGIGDSLSPTWGVPEIRGTTPNRSLYYVNLKTGVTLTVATTGDPSNPVPLPDGSLLYQTTAGPKVFEPVAKRSVEPYSLSTYSSHIGDSLTAGGDAARTQIQAEIPSITVANNFGVSGTTSTECAFRVGALPVTFTFPSNTIPATTAAVDITLADPLTSWRSSGATTVAFTYAVVAYTAAGVAVPGTVVQYSNESPRRFTFQRTTAGAAAVLPGPVTLRGTQGVGKLGGLTVIWVGRNNVNIDTVTRDVAAMVAFLEAHSKRYLIHPITNGQDEPSGSAGYNSIMAINAALAAAYPDHFVDVRAYLINDALAYLGLTPTAADTTAISQDRIPPQLHTDTIHFTAAAQTAIGHFDATHFKTKYGV